MYVTFVCHSSEIHCYKVCLPGPNNISLLLLRFSFSLVWLCLCFEAVAALRHCLCSRAFAEAEVSYLSTSQLDTLSFVVYVQGIWSWTATLSLTASSRTSSAARPSWRTSRENCWSSTSTRSQTICTNLNRCLSN